MARQGRPVRIVTATSRFDGHDAAINIIRRILQSEGAEVIHLGHDRGVEEIVVAAIQEDADAVAVSCYQGGHNEFFGFLVDRLAGLGAGHIRVYGGGGGTILPEEIKALHARGVAQIFSPDAGRRLGLVGMIRRIIDDCTAASRKRKKRPGLPTADDALSIARAITFLESPARGEKKAAAQYRKRIVKAAGSVPAPVMGITGTGGAGKSTLVDELLRRLLAHAPRLRIGVLLVDPSRRRSGGALLGDRIRLNSIDPGRVFVRSLATRQSHASLSGAVPDAVAVLRAAGFDLVVVETAGIGQGDSRIVDISDLSLYVMTPEYGAPSQLEKIDALELADLVVLNKVERRGGQDALRDVRKQVRRNLREFYKPDVELPVFPTSASRFGDTGCEALTGALIERLEALGVKGMRAGSSPPTVQPAEALIPGNRAGYLANVSRAVRKYHERTGEQAERVADAWACARALGKLGGPSPRFPHPLPEKKTTKKGREADRLRREYRTSLSALDADLAVALEQWPETRKRYAGEQQHYLVRDREVAADNFFQTLSGLDLPRVSLPGDDEPAALARFLRSENLPGHFPYTAGVYPFTRRNEFPTRMFAGEGGPERTNRRFHLLAHGQPTVRLSTAFDGVTLYGHDPASSPDIHGKVGDAGVSICTVDHVKILYSGFELCSPKTSVSMTINGPAPAMLAMFLNAAVDQEVEKYLRGKKRLSRVRGRFKDRPAYRGALPAGHSGLGLGLLGIRGDQAVDRRTYARIRARALSTVRGTVQADILKEDQAQNTCIFSTEFALKLMGDIQTYFCEKGVRNFYSVSVSGYHIAEAGANPVTQLAFTLANAFTLCEYYLGRGMKVDDFAPNLSFFFSNGMDAEYSVLGRVARRIWAVAMRDIYGANERSQKLKYHIQTSGRSLHAQEMAFNDIRTTLQALMALRDRCDSLHTNAFDEAVTTPTEASVRRAMAIQLIIQQELGLNKNENAAQGSYFMEQLTDRVEQAVLEEFENLSSRGDVLGAMEHLYQRSKIQEESLKYESLKHSGELPIVGVNTFEAPGGAEDEPDLDRVQRATETEKKAQRRSLKRFQKRWKKESGPALQKLKSVALSGGNVFAELMETVKVCSLGQATDALFEVGGRYRRSM